MTMQQSAIGVEVWGDAIRLQKLIVMHFIKSLIMSSGQNSCRGHRHDGVTEPNFTRPLFRCNEGVVQFSSVSTKYPMCDNDQLMGVLIL
jgi:hypothetical protein